MIKRSVVVHTFFPLFHTFRTTVHTLTMILFYFFHVESLPLHKKTSWPTKDVVNPIRFYADKKSVRAHSKKNAR